MSQFLCPIIWSSNGNYANTLTHTDTWHDWTWMNVQDRMNDWLICCLFLIVTMNRISRKRTRKRKRSRINLSVSSDSYFVNWNNWILTLPRPTWWTFPLHPNHIRCHHPCPLLLDQMIPHSAERTIAAMVDWQQLMLAVLKRRRWWTTTDHCHRQTYWSWQRIRLSVVIMRTKISFASILDQVKTILVLVQLRD